MRNTRLSGSHKDSLLLPQLSCEGVSEGLSTKCRIFGILLEPPADWRWNFSLKNTPACSSHNTPRSECYQRHLDDFKCLFQAERSCDSIFGREFVLLMAHVIGFLEQGHSPNRLTLGKEFADLRLRLLLAAALDHEENANKSLILDAGSVFFPSGVLKIFSFSGIVVSWS